MGTETIQIRLTKGRLSRGLIAIPKEFHDWFPVSDGYLSILFDRARKPRKKRFRTSQSSARELRIYGLRAWYKKHHAEEGDWIEISRKGSHYHFVFCSRKRLEASYRRQIERAKTEAEASEALDRLAELQRKRTRRAALEELRRLAHTQIARKYRSTPARAHLERVPSGIRVLLQEVYQGKCQICGFSFMKKDGTPYFEVHHIVPTEGHHPKNLLVLCANCHAQMEHAQVSFQRTPDGWVEKVVINGVEKRVYQALCETQ